MSAKNLASDGMTPGLSEHATKERNCTLWLDFRVWRNAYDGGLRLGGNFEVNVVGGGWWGEEKHVVLLLNLVKHLSNWPVVGSSGCIVTTIQ